MKKKFFPLIAVALSICMLFSQMSLAVDAVASIVGNDGVVNATAYADDCFEEIIEIMLLNQDFADRISSINNLSLADPYIVFHADKLTQDEIYYFPVVDLGNESVVYLIAVINYDGDFQINTMDSLIELLNYVDYINNDCLFYISNGEMYVETATEVVSVNDFYCTDEAIESQANLSAEAEDSFLVQSFEEKRTMISTRMANLCEITRDATYDAENYLDAKNYGVLTLYRPQGQHGYNMCWACAVANVQNYIRGTVVTGFEVCSRMSIGYNSGGTVYDIQDALAIYNIEYDYIRNSDLTWNQIKTNIDGEKPIIANCFPNNSTVGHAITIYGYTGTSSANGVVTYWDSNLSNANGGTATFEFGTGGSVLGDIYGVAYFWETTVSYY